MKALLVILAREDSDHFLNVLMVTFLLIFVIIARMTWNERVDDFRRNSVPMVWHQEIRQARLTWLGTGWFMRHSVLDELLRPQQI